MRPPAPRRNGKRRRVLSDRNLHESRCQTTARHSEVKLADDDWPADGGINFFHHLSVNRGSIDVHAVYVESL